MAFHEAFGDFNAMCNSLQHNELLEELYLRTLGDLTKPNFAAALADEFAMALYRTPIGQTQSLRALLNDYVYADPNTLPTKTASSPNDALYNEPHSFSQVMSGAIYDFLRRVFEDNQGAGVRGRRYAFKTALNTVTQMVYDAVKVAPANPTFYNSFAQALVWVDATTGGGKYYPIIADVFGTKRRILRTASPMKTGLRAAGTRSNPYFSVNQKRREFIRLTEEGLPPANPLFKLRAEVPMDSVLGMHEDGRVVSHTQATRPEAVKSLRAALTYLHSHDLVGDGPHHDFTEKNGDLVRKQFSCRFL